MANKPLVLRPGDTVKPVGNLQEQLNAVGYYGLQVDNVFGPATERAVRDFQRQAGLPVTGIVDEATWRRLFVGYPLPAEVVGGDPPADPPEFPAVGGYSIEVNRGARTLTLLRNGVVQAVFPIAIGKPSTPTPLGNFTILNKAWNPGGPFGTRWLGVTWDGIGIHGTGDPSSIGLAVSNGCIRLYNQDIESFFNAVNVGDPVRIIAGQVAGNTYTVQPGDTLYLIAQRFGTTVAELMQANGLTTDFIYPGQVLFIPGAAAPPPPPPPPPSPTPGTMTYTVQPGDTLYLIAQRFGTTLEELRRLNNLTGDVIYAGQTLLVPSAAVPETYTVQSGDTLFTIAQRFGTTVAELRRLNDLTTDTIYPGQVLRVR
ncbi:MAG TPA: LysM peptidoglycan-binding domain-containing protein [Firmicutes bacterium]|nr:LysM peptidoglycan-binding domain-containing protein [Bacillota bacterium]